MKITEEEFLNYYEQGLKDSEISRISGDCPATINVLRRKLQLPPNGRKIMQDEEFLDLYNLGKTDAEIANIVGCSPSQVKRRRDKYGFPVNIKQTELTRRFEELYNQGLNDVEIANIIGYSKSRVQDYRKKLGFPAIGKHSLDINEVKKLCEEGKSDEEIAEKLGYSKSYILKCRNAILDIHYRNTKPNDYIYSGEELQVLLGSILGDGNLQKRYKTGGTILKISHCEKQKEYIEYKQNLLKNNCSEVKKYYLYDDRRKNPNYFQYTIYTKSSLDLNKYYENWYKPNKQIFKEDLYKLEPLGLAIWYMDDGYKNKPYGGCTLCTNCFNTNSLEILKEF